MIEIIRIGGQYPVDALLVWENGRNILKLYVNVYYPTAELTPAIQAFLAQNETAWKLANLPGVGHLLREDLLKIDNSPQRAARKANVEAGIKDWANTYTVFGGQKVTVQVTVQESAGSNNALEVHLLDTSAVLAFLDQRLQKQIDDISMSWGGKGIYDWRPDGYKFILMRVDSQNVAKHEFGHTFGVGDAYAGPVFGPGVDVITYPDTSNSVMLSSINSVTNNDIEMVILAFSMGKRQNYQIGLPWQKISEALGQGN